MRNTRKTWFRSALNFCGVSCMIRSNEMKKGTDVFDVFLMMEDGEERSDDF